LLAHGADSTLKDARGNDALGDATRENRAEAIEVLRKAVGSN
jgi:ankyrin repeat protein